MFTMYYTFHLSEILTMLILLYSNYYFDKLIRKFHDILFYNEQRITNYEVKTDKIINSNRSYYEAIQDEFEKLNDKLLELEQKIDKLIERNSL